MDRRASRVGADNYAGPDDGFSALGRQCLRSYGIARPVHGRAVCQCGRLGRLWRSRHLTYRGAGAFNPGIGAHGGWYRIVCRAKQRGHHEGGTRRQAGGSLRHAGHCAVRGAGTTLGSSVFYALMGRYHASRHPFSSTFIFVMAIGAAFGLAGCLVTLSMERPDNRTEDAGMARTSG